MEHLQDLMDHVIIKTGDLIVDEETGFVGVLIKKERRIDMFMDDLYFWHIKWIKNIDRHGESVENVNMLNYVEEEGLKLSIAVGALTIYSPDKEEHEF
jgi:hypothetical protein